MTTPIKSIVPVYKTGYENRPWVKEQEIPKTVVHNPKENRNASRKEMEISVNPYVGTRFDAYA